MFAQVACVQDEESFAPMKVYQLIAVCVGIFVCCVYTLVITYQYHANEMNFLLWDIQTATVNDYSVELALNKRFWNEYESHKEKIPMEENENYSEHLQTFIKSFMETKLYDYAQEIDR